MNKPVVLDGDVTCFQCANFWLCYARRKQQDVIDDCSHMLDIDAASPKYPRLFAVLASVCNELDFRPDPPRDEGEPAQVTILVQVPRQDDADDVVYDLNAVLLAQKIKATVEVVS